MKMDVLTGMLVAIVGLVIGFLSSRGGLGVEDPEKTAGENLRTGPGKQTASVITGAEEEHSLAALEKLLKRSGAGPDYQVHMARLSTWELRNFLIGNSTFHSRAARAAAKELFRREGSAALEWADGRTPKVGDDQQFLLILAAAVENPPLAKPWVEIYQNKRRGTMAGAWNPFLQNAIRDASSQGVDALLRLRDVYGAEEMGKSDLVRGTVPEDFDFRRLMEEFPRARGAEAVVRLWAGKDPDAAWKTMRELYPPNVMSGYTDGFFSGMVQTVGEDAAIRWLAPKLDEFEPWVRQSMLRSLLNDRRIDYRGAETVMAGLPSDADRVALVAGMISPYRDDVPLRVLERLASPVLRVEALLQSARNKSRYTSDPDEPMARPTNELFADLMEELEFPLADREKVWTALLTPSEH